MTGFQIETGEEILLLAMISLCFLLASMLFAAAVRAKKEELVDRRLDGFRLEKPAPHKTQEAPLRINLEKQDELEERKKRKSVFLISGLFGNRGLNRRLVRAGYDPARYRRPFYIARILCFCLEAFLAAFLFDAVLAEQFGPLITTVLVLAAGISGSFLPNILLKFRIRQRRRRIERAMPDMIDLLILCVEAGLTLETALVRTIEGLEPFAPDVAAEMKITLSELRILPDKSMALTNLADRTASKSLKYLVLSLRQAERYGTSITGALKAVAMENRKMAILELENNASRMPALLSVPLILFILPPVVAISAGPGFALMMRTIGG
ncbi:type II secretion system F family protein [uncultured Sneathiella sp.]|uniref:type II secretion system F family protein n=1 Tax=uncultured Sneathiella sp. TaxID=879315 RepID=UPI0030DB3F2F